MASASHQTVKLCRGKHESPEQGVCVMELASMLAGEPFSDHPVAVCPVVGAVLRSYNDCVDDARRQDLYPYAAKAVGSRSSERIERVRLARLAEWTLELERRGWTRFVPERWRFPARRTAVGVVRRATAAIGRRTESMHPTVLALIDELLLVEEPPGLAKAEALQVPDAVFATASGRR